MMPMPRIATLPKVNDTAADHAELLAIDHLLQIPDGLLVVAPRAGKTAALEVRCRVNAAMRALGELVNVVESMPPGAARSELQGVLSRWRNRRAYIFARVAPAKI